jgi:hypothetical protein
VTKTEFEKRHGSLKVRQRAFDAMPAKNDAREFHLQCLKHMQLRGIKFREGEILENCTIGEALMASSDLQPYTKIIRGRLGELSEL